MKKSSKYGVVHGRFQPFHTDHLTYAMEAFKRCDFLFVGITNPDANEMTFHLTDPARSRDISNPLTYWERSLLVSCALREAGVPDEKFCVVPFPLNNVKLLKYYVPMDARFYMTIYDNWGIEKRDILVSLGLDVEVMWERDIEQKNVTATTIRQSIAAGKQWETLVPHAVAIKMKELGLDGKIRDITKMEDK